MFDFDDLEVAVPVGPDGRRGGGEATVRTVHLPDGDDPGGTELAPAVEVAAAEEPPARSLAAARAHLAAGDAAGAEALAAGLLREAPAEVHAYKLKKVRLQALLHPEYRPPRGAASPSGQALALAQSLADEQPTDTSLPALLGRALRLHGKRKEADALWERAAAKEGPEGEVRQLLRSLAVAEEEKKKGNTAFKDSQWEAACAAYARALEADALRVDRDLAAAVLGNRSAARRKLAQFDEALADAEESLRMSPDYVKARFRRALVLMQFERYAEALADLQAVRQREPSTAGLEEWILRAEHWSSSKQKNHYAALGAPMDATQEEIKRAHKRMALKWHPDKAGGACSKEECEERFKAGGACSKEECEERFKAIQEAFEILSAKDEQQRDLYDFGRLRPRQSQPLCPSSGAAAAYAAKKEPMPKQLVKMGFGTVRKGDGITTCMCCGEKAETYWEKKQHIIVTDHPGFIDEKAVKAKK